MFSCWEGRNENDSGLNDSLSRQRAFDITD